jgi:integrase/recombinase XerD
MNSADQTVIEGFIDRLWMERGLSDNTLNAYRTDLQGLARWLREKEGIGCSMQTGNNCWRIYRQECSKALSRALLPV